MQPPQTINIKSDNNILTFIEITKQKTYKYQYTKSITKLGTFLELNDIELTKLIKNS
jgi:hypothetical protein